MTVYQSFIVPCLGEAKKQVRSHTNTFTGIIATLVWPFLSFISVLYTYFSFDLSFLQTYGFQSQNEFITYLVIGSLGFNCYWSMVNSALTLMHERMAGTLEIIFLSPANQLSLMYGRALGGFFQFIWIYVAFSSVLIIITNRLSIGTLLSIFLMFIVVLISSIVWGGFINCLFILSRDSDFWFSLFNAPMDLFSGTSIPISTFPSWAVYISNLFPLTYSLYFMRQIFFSDNVELYRIIGFIASLLVLVILSIIILKRANTVNKNSGGLKLY